MATVGSYTLPDNLYYEVENHLWLLERGNLVTLGLDMLGQASMGDMAYIRLDSEGKQVRRGDEIGSLEAAKMVAPILSPLSGTIVKKNPAVEQQPHIVNESPYDRGWLITLEPTDWHQESKLLLSGADNVAGFLAQEIGRYQERGWID